jgi:beta-phosphoglucomutase
MPTDRSIKASIFDLDGVIVDTARFHFIAWRRLANELGFDFDEKQNEKLKGVSRMGSLELILKWGDIRLTEDEKQHWAAQKNEWYREFVLKMTADDILEGALPYLEATKEAGQKVVLGSASKNTPTIIEKIGLEHFFDAVIDGNKTTRSKPDPQVFEMGAEAVGVQPSASVVFEDASKGVDAALNGGFWAVGIGQPAILGHAHLVIPNFIGRTPSEIQDLLLNPTT